MANTNTPKDYVIATGKLHSVEDFCKIAFSYVNLDFKDYVRQSNEILRLVETPPATGDASLIKSDLGWAPKISFNDLVQTMVQAELDSPYLP
jgi:GDPmannose 4,6-dehydratase